MIRRLLPAKLVNPGGSVSDCFVSFLAFPDRFSSTTEGILAAVWIPAGYPIPLYFTKNNKPQLPSSGNQRTRIMYVCGTVAADLFAGFIPANGQPRFLTATIPAKENITIAYVLNPKRLRQKP